jgi:hypothetical protein
MHTASRHHLTQRNREPTTTSHKPFGPTRPHPETPCHVKCCITRLQLPQVPMRQLGSLHTSCSVHEQHAQSPTVNSNSQLSKQAPTASRPELLQPLAQYSLGTHPCQHCHRTLHNHPNASSSNGSVVAAQPQAQHPASVQLPHCCID